MSFVNQGNYNDACQYYLRYETQRNCHVAGAVDNDDSDFLWLRLN